MNPGLISIDWGSTNCRATLLSAGGAILERRDGGAGILSRHHGELADQLREVVEPWRECHGTLPVIVSGMAGSRTGLVEVPYLDCPAGIADIASSLRKIDAGIVSKCWLVPGLKGRTPQDLPDVMRGEEIQIVGLLEHRAKEGGAQLLVLPGTHCKWVLAVEGRVHQFATSISGELYAILQRLGSFSTLTGDAEGVGLDRDRFLETVELARRPGGLLHHLFGLRVGVLLDEFPPQELYPRLSALVIGHEIEAMLAMFRGAGKVGVIGERTLGSLYCDALALKGIQASFTEAHVASAIGAAKVACAAGLIT